MEIETDVKALADLAQRKPIELGGMILRPNDWTAEDPNGLKKAPPAFALPKAAPLKVATLGALRDYLKTNRDGLKLETLIAHVESPNRVSVGSALREPARDREVYITAEAVDMAAGFVGGYVDVEDFTIGLQVRFCDVDHRGALLQMIGTVSVEQSTTAIDDGVSQRLEARGAALRSHVSIPNPVILAPYRTFRDIMQPSSPFVLRARAEAGETPDFALFEADGGTWKLSAIERIKDWLDTELGALGVAILA